MKPLPTLLLCVAGAAAGTGLGWLLRGAPAIQASPAAPAAGNGASAAGGKNKFGPSQITHSKDAAKDELGAELARQTGAMRWLYLLGAAEQATAADMPRLIRAGNGMPGALRMLAVRWAELDPQHMFDSLRTSASRYRAGGAADLSTNYDLPQILFEEWTKKDPEAAIAALNDRSALPQTEGLRHSLTNALMKSDPARGLKLMTEWNITTFIPGMGGIEKWAESDPRAAAEAVVTNKLGHAMDDALKRVGKAWAATDPAAALAFAAQTRGLAGIHLAQSVMTEWAQRDPDAAIAHVSSQNDSLALTRLGIPLVEAWAKSDPQAALLWANENLKGEARAAAAASVVKTMATGDIKGAAEFIAGIESGGARNRAINQLMEIWIGNEKGSGENGARATAALQWMAILPDADARQQASQSAWRLMYYAPEETIAFLTGPQGHVASQVLFDHAALHLAQKNPESAMQWTAGLPPERRTSARHSVLDEWLSTRPEAAMDWVRALPNGDERAGSIAAATQSLAWQSMETTRQWLASLPAPDHDAARKGLSANGSLTAENRTALEVLLK